MSQKKPKLKHRINQFGASVGVSPARLLLSFILVIAIGVLIWIVAFPGNDEVAVDEPSRTVQTTKKGEPSVDQRLESLLTSKPVSTGNFLMIIEEMRTRTRTLEDIERQTVLNAAQQAKADLIKVRNGGVIVRYMLENDIDYQDEWTELQTLCKKHVDADNEVLGEAANYWLAIIPLIDFTRDANQETFATFTEMLSRHSKGFLLNPSHAIIFANWVKGMRRTNQPDEYVVKAHEFMSEQLSKSELPQIKFLGEQMGQLALYGQFNLGTLRDRIAWKDPSAASDLAGAMTTFKENVDATNFATWATIVRAYESFLATDDIESAGQTWQAMSKLVDGLADSERKSAMQGILTNQATRARKIGSKFDVSGSTFPNDEPLDLSDDKYTLIIYCNKKLESRELLGKLKKAISIGQLDYLPILVLEEELNETDSESMGLVPKVIQVANRETVLKYQDNFPVNFFPYLLLIDKDGTLVSANVDFDQVPNRIARLEAQRRARAGK